MAISGWEAARGIADWLEGQLQDKAHEQIDRLEKAWKENAEAILGVKQEQATTPHYQKVEQFMHGAMQTVPDDPCIPSEEVRLLRAKLILEEAVETIHALGFTPRALGDPDDIADVVTFDDDLEPNLKEIIDGCCDLKVVTTGTLIACGVPDEYPQKLVDDNNLEKIEKGTIREDGKLIKPPDHQPPDIAGFLKEIGYEGEENETL